MAAYYPIENVRYINQKQSHNEKTEPHFEEPIQAFQLKDAVYVYGRMNKLRPYGRNFVVPAGVDVYNLYKGFS